MAFCALARWAFAAYRFRCLAFDDTQRMLFVENEIWPAWLTTMQAFFFSSNVLAAAAAIRTLERRQHDQMTLMAGAACRF